MEQRTPAAPLGARGLDVGFPVPVKGGRLTLPWPQLHLSTRVLEQVCPGVECAALGVYQTNHFSGNLLNWKQKVF